MGRTPCCEKEGLKKGPWTPEEDQILISYIRQFGHCNWRTLPKLAGLLRCGKSCRLRWTNYLRPDIKRGDFTTEEEETIINLHQVLGNRWAAIAAKLPGRTDNDIKNFWRTHLKKRLFNNTVMISTNATKDPESKSESEASNLTKTVTAAAILEDKINQKGKNVGNDSLDSDEDLWADVLSDASFSVAVESGFEAQSMVGPPICDVTTINHTWWHEDDFNLDNSLRRSWELPEI